MMEKVDCELFETTLEFTKRMIEIITELELSEKKQTIRAKANCNYKIVEEFINLYDGYDVACVCGSFVDNYDLEFEDGITVLFREYPKKSWESIYRIYISNDEDFIEKNRLVYDEDIEEYVFQDRKENDNENDISRI